MILRFEGNQALVPTGRRVIGRVTGNLDRYALEMPVQLPIVVSGSNALTPLQGSITPGNPPLARIKVAVESLSGCPNHSFAWFAVADESGKISRIPLNPFSFPPGLTNS